MSVFAKDDKSGWIWKLLSLSDFNFNRLNHDIAGAPIYFNGRRVWPKPADGTTVIWEDGDDAMTEYSLTGQYDPSQLTGDIEGLYGRMPPELQKLVRKIIDASNYDFAAMVLLDAIDVEWRK